VLVTELNWNKLEKLTFTILMVSDMLRLTLNIDLSKIPFVHF